MRKAFLSPLASRVLFTVGLPVMVLLLVTAFRIGFESVQFSSTMTESGDELFEMEYGVPFGAHNLTPGFLGGRAFNLTNGDLFGEVYQGDRTALLAMATGVFNATSMVRADFDNDAMPDVAVAYASSAGGLISIRRGNPDVISSMSNAATERVNAGLTTDNPFADRINVWSVPLRPEWLESGDFDNDGTADLIVAETGENEIHLLSGNGLGSFSAPAKTLLDGELTHMIAGEFGRKDGLPELAIATLTDSGVPGVWLYGGKDGALNAEPDHLTLSHPINELSFADLTGNGSHSLIALSDAGLHIADAAAISGNATTFTDHSLPFRPVSIAVGQFTDELSPLGQTQGAQLALLSESGSIYMWENGTLSSEIARFPNFNPDRAELQKSRVADTFFDALVALDGNTEQVHVLTQDHFNAALAPSLRGTAPESSGLPAPKMSPISLPSGGLPVDIISTRYNQDALDDLILLTGSTNGGFGIGNDVSVSLSKPQVTFMVNADGNDNDGDLDDLVCDTGNNDDGFTGLCTLYAAIAQSNRLNQTEIMFSIPSVTIPEDGWFTKIESSVVINGQIGTSNRVAITSAESGNIGGAQAMFHFDGVASGNSTVKNTEIANLNSVSAVFFEGSSNNVVQGNYFHDNGDGAISALAHQSEPASSSNITVGGLTVQPGTGLGNVLSGNDEGMRFGNYQDPSGVGAGSHLVQGNIIGASAAGPGMADQANERGVIVERSVVTGTVIGGVTSTARNIISGNELEGIRYTPGSTAPTGAGLTIQGNYVGTDITGMVAVPNKIGIQLYSTDNIVGGSADGAQNLVSGNSESGVRLSKSGSAPLTQGNLIQANIIGLAVDGESLLGNGTDGIEFTLGATDNQIIGNTISGNGNNGIYLAGHGSGPTTDNVIDNNTIGLNETGTTARPNEFYGVRINNAADNLVGDVFGNVISGNATGGVFVGGALSVDNIIIKNRIGTDAQGLNAVPNLLGIKFHVNAGPNLVGGLLESDGNTIAFNTEEGVRVISANGIRILGNSIFQNGTEGIDLDEDGNSATNDGSTPNDAGDLDSGPNGLQNFPVITSVRDGSTIVAGTLSSKSNTTYRVEFFSNTETEPDGLFEGQNFLGSADVLTDGNGNGQFEETFPGSETNITATATAPDGSTSEYYAASGLIVNSVADNSDQSAGDGECDTGETILRSGTPEPECTLRAAIEETNASDETIVKFDIPGNGPHVIDVLTLLPNIQKPVTFDAATQPGFADSPIVEVTTNTSISGLTVTGGGATVRGLAIHSFVGSGIRLEGGGGNAIEGNYIGTDASGSEDKGNQRGVQITNSAGNTIGGTSPAQRNIISGSSFNGIQIDGAGSTSNRIIGNYIGTTKTGTEPLRNSQDGVRIYDGASGNMIGGSETGARNLISGNGDYGVYIIGATANKIYGNYIGVEESGTCTLTGNQRCPVQNGGGGILLEGEVSNTEIGGFTAASGNVISGNLGPGITIKDAVESATSIRANKIGVDKSGTSSIKNAGDGILVENATGVTIGADSEPESNLISENEFHGVHVKGQSAGDVVITGNQIGRVDGDDLVLMNGNRGIAVTEGAVDVTIGGYQPGEGNDIWGGVQITGLTTAGVSVQNNTIKVPWRWLDDINNMRVPMQLGTAGPACNAWTDGSGPNQGISPPRLVRVGTEYIEGMTRPGETVEIFQAESLGDKRGRYFPSTLIPLTNVTADERGHFSAEISAVAGTLISATSTDTDGNTSEFSQLRRPVVVAPGIGGSWLEGPNGENVWIPVNTSQTMNDLLASMAMLPDGSEDGDITESGILEFLPPPDFELPPELEVFRTNVYGHQLVAIEAGGFPGSLHTWDTASGTPTPVNAIDLDLWRFPTDWRLNQAELASQLNDRVDWLTSDIPDIARTCEVDIVGHSNGGVITSVYLQTESYKSQDKVHRFISSGAPYMGAIRAMGAHTSGYVFELEESIKHLAPDWGRMIQMARNLPATYSLMPGRSYWEASKQFELGGDESVMEDLNGSVLVGYDETFDFMTRSKNLAGLDRNASIWNQVGSDVNDVIDDWREWDRPPHIFRQVGDAPVKLKKGHDSDLAEPAIRTVVGWYNDPMAVKRNLEEGNLRIEPGDGPLQVAYRAAQVPILGLGDTTVPLSSATLGREASVGKKDFSGVQRTDMTDNPWIEEFEYYPCAHVDLVTDGCVDKDGRSALERTVEILKTGYEASLIDNPSPGKRPSQDRLAFQGTPGIQQNILYISGTTHLGVHIEDASGNHTGPTEEDGYRTIDFEIPGMGYYPNDFGAVVAFPDKEEYTITVRAVEAEAEIQVTRMMAMSSGDRDNILFPNTVVQQGGGLQIVLEDGTTPTSTPLSLDADGDGGYESVLNPAATVTSPGAAPAIPIPRPYRIEHVSLISDGTDVPYQISFADGGNAVWAWSASNAAPWMSPSAEAGQVPTSIDLVLNASTLPEGNYSDTLHVELSTGGYSVSYPVVVELSVVNQRALSTIQVSPQGVSLDIGETHQFTAEGFDQFGDPISFSTVWSTNGGSIDGNGLFTAGQTGGQFSIGASDITGLIVGTVLVSIGGATGLEGEFTTGEIPTEYNLYQNYPNPFNPVTQIIYDVKETSRVLLKVYDVMGREVQTLIDRSQAPGRYQAQFDASQLPSGPYLMRIQMHNFAKTVTMMVLK